MDDRRRVALLTTLAKDQAVAADSPSPFYAALIARMLEDVRVGGPTWTLLEPYATKPPSEWYCFRALSGVHYEVLAGERPELARHWPSVGGDGDAEAAWPHVRDAFTDRDPAIVADLRHPLQTNETSRCGALIGGFLAVARATGLPLRVLELGSSGGLNLHFDRYRYEADGAAFGPADSAVRFVDYWEGGTPDLAAPLEVHSRRGCDLDPIDPTTDHGRRTLESCLWPDEHIRFANLRAALDIARAFPVELDQESADTWIARQLAEPVSGRRDRRLPLGLLALPARRRPGQDPGHDRGGRPARHRRRPARLAELRGRRRPPWRRRAAPAPVAGRRGAPAGNRPSPLAPGAMARLTRAASDQRDAGSRSPTCARGVQPRDG